MEVFHVFQVLKSVCPSNHGWRLLFPACRRLVEQQSRSYLGSKSLIGSAQEQQKEQRLQTFIYLLPKNDFNLFKVCKPSKIPKVVL